MINRKCTIIILFLYIVLFTGCFTTTSPQFAQKRSDTNESKLQSFDQKSLCIDHPFPFYLYTDVDIPTNQTFGIAEVSKLKITKDIVQKLMDYFSHGMVWKDETGDPIILSNNTSVSVYQFQENDDTVAAFYTNGDNNFVYTSNQETVVMREEYLYDSPERTQDFLDEPKISYEDAFAIANKTISDLDFVIDKNLTLCYGTKAIAYTGDNPKAYGWEFVFTRSCNGLQSPFRSEYDLWANSPLPVSCAPWERECLFVFVDEKGLYSIDARGLGQQKGVVNNDVSLLPAEAVKECIIKQIKVQHPHQEEGTKNWTIGINKIQLCSVLVSDENGLIGYMVPAWEVEYTLEYSIGVNHKVFLQYTYINAVDGTYIEPRVTVNDVRNAYGVK